MGGIAVRQMADRIAAPMEERLRVRGNGLREKLRAGGRRLPSRIRREAEYLAEAAFLAQSPKFEPMLDDARIAAAHDACLRHLKGVRRRGRLSGFMRDVAGSVVVQRLLVAALAVGVAMWRGLL
jgi:hypothetical protein